MPKNNVTKHHWRVFVEADVEANSPVELSENEAHYVRNVLRLNENEKVEIFDGKGLLALGQVASISKKSVSVKIESLTRASQPKNKVTILCGHPKPSNLADVVAAACETGATEIVLFSSDHSKNNNLNEERLQKIARESLRVSKWLWETQISSHKNLESAWTYCTSASNFAVFWCDELLDLNSPTQVPSLSQAIQNIQCDHVVIVIGPEAGFSESERSFLQNKKVQAVSLGPCILRVPVAVTAAVTAFYQST